VLVRVVAEQPGWVALPAAAWSSDADEHHHELPADVVAPTLEDHLCWLREADFAEVDCVWKQFSEVLLCGFRST